MQQSTFAVALALVSTGVTAGTCPYWMSMPDESGRTAGCGADITSTLPGAAFDENLAQLGRVVGKMVRVASLSGEQVVINITGPAQRAAAVAQMAEAALSALPDGKKNLVRYAVNIKPSADVVLQMTRGQTK